VAGAGTARGHAIASAAIDREGNQVMNAAHAERAADVTFADTAGIEHAIAAACGRIAPLWPLKHFVAVNPFLGFSGQSFAATCATMRRVARTDMLMPRAFYRQAIADGTILPDDIALARNAMADAALPDAGELLMAAIARDPQRPSGRSAVVATVAEVLDRLAAGDRQASRTAFMVDEIGKFCAAFFDEGQAAWRMPQRHLGLWQAWRAVAAHDRSPEIMGIRHFRATIAGLAADPVAAIAGILHAHGIPPHAFVDYLHRALFDIGGWAAYARYLVWDNGLYGRADDTLVQLLAVRMAWGHALFRERTDAAFQAAWAQEMATAAVLPADDRPGDDPDLAIDLLLHEAYEAGFQRRLLGRLEAHMAGAVLREGPGAGGAPVHRPRVQAAFCIDVRSEVIRRAIETVADDIATIGFAGFFGFPIEYIPIGRSRGGAQCPVLLTPAFTVCEAVHGADAETETEVLGLRLLRRRAAKAWKSFKLSAVSSFTFVEAMGLTYAAKIVGDSAGITRPVTDPNTDGLDGTVIGRIGPRLEPRPVDGRATGFTDDQRLAMAEAVLRAMSLTGPFARLVLLAGHGSSTVNNPHASGLDCGACGGHTGEANARVAASILNDPHVRIGLGNRGLMVPADTWFVAGLHDTTTDDIRLFDRDAIPPGFAADVAALESDLATASAIARRERSALLALDGSQNVDAQVLARSRDWSQVRPEWGLAGCAAFIAAPRARSRGLDLAGRAFLHDYRWQDDAGFGVLKLIITAPMVVASWISLQYYGSTVNNAAFGAGHKALHNVVGQLGVLEGNAGDLKVGLPWQSVHDGSRFIHEPLRLNVIIQAPEAEIDAVIAGSQMVRELVDNGWLHMFAMADETSTLRRRVRGGGWE
jgi:uncharacterized protein